MAIFYCEMNTVSRGEGRSIVAASAYRNACKLEDSRTGKIHNYTQKQGVESSEIYLPSGVNPAWAQDREKLWNAAERAEKRKDARLGREIVLALPAELPSGERQKLAGDMARYLADRYCLAVDVAIHQPSRKGDARNHHAHLLMSSRRVTAEGFGGKSQELDDWKQGPKEIEHIRIEWERLANHALERAGQQSRIDHRSLKAQGIRRAPTVHLGPSACAMERRGIRTRLGDMNREASSLNEHVAKQEQELLQLERMKTAQQEKAKEDSRRENLRKSAEEHRDNFEIASCIASIMFNGDAKALLEQTNYPKYQIEYFLERMESIGCVDKNYNVIINTDSRFWSETVHNFCKLKQITGEKIYFSELSLTGMSDKMIEYKRNYELKKYICKDEQKTPSNEINVQPVLRPLDGAELLPLIEQQKSALAQADKCYKERNAEWIKANNAMQSAKYAIQNYNITLQKTGFLKRLYLSNKIKEKKEELEKAFMETLKRKEVANKVCEDAQNIMNEAKSTLEKTQKSYEASLHGERAKVEYHFVVVSVGLDMKEKERREMASRLADEWAAKPKEERNLFKQQVSEQLKEAVRETRRQKQRDSDRERD